MTACRSSRFLPVTRSWSPWIWAWTPFGPSSRIFLLIALAFSDSIPWMILQSIRYVLPDCLGSPASSDFSEICRLTSFSLNTSRAARARSSVSAWSVTPSSPDHLISAPVPRKSNRVPSSFSAWLSALSTSCRSTLLTTSNEGAEAIAAPESRSWCGGLGPSLPDAPVTGGAGVPVNRCHAGPVPVCEDPGGCRYPYVRCRANARRCPEAGCPSGQWERTVNPSRKLQRFESSTRHTVQERPLTSHNGGPGGVSSALPK